MSLVQGFDGNFYGTTSESGIANKFGTVFKITPGGTLTTLHSFHSETRCLNGSTPYAGLILGTDGNFYGTTTTDGAGVGGRRNLCRFCRLESDAVDSPRNYTLQTNDL